MLHWIESYLHWGFYSSHFLSYHVNPVSVLVMSGFHKGQSGWSPSSSFQWAFTAYQVFPLKKFPRCWAKMVKIIPFFVTSQKAPAEMGSVLSVSIVSERTAFFLSRALLWSSFDWKYFACLTTCWWIFLCQVMCQELAEHSKLITCVHTVKEKQTARHRWYEEWDFISVTRDCVVNESTQSAGNW